MNSMMARTNAQPTLADLIKLQTPGIAKAIGGTTPQERKARAERFARVAVTAIGQNPNLQRCDPKTFLGCLMQCAQLNLEPNTPQGLAYIIPYGTQAQFQIGYKGLIQLMWRSGAVASFNADVVYEAEVLNGTFEYESGMAPVIHHRIDLLHPEYRTGQVVAAYACATLKTGQSVIRVVSHADIEKARSLAGRNSPAWRDHYESMAIKTAIKRLAAWLPQTDVLAQAIAADDGVSVQPEPERAQVNVQPSVDTLNTMLAAAPEAPKPVEALPEQHQPDAVDSDSHAPVEKGEVKPSSKKAAAQPKEPPFEPDSAPAEVPQPKPQATPAPGEKIRCPNSGKMVDDVADCPNCPHRKGCSQWD